MKVLLGYDGSKDAEAALRDLSRAGLPSDTRVKVVTVITVWQPRVPGIQFNSRLSREAVSVGEQALKDAKALAGKGAAKLRKAFPGWTVDAEAMLDTPAEGLLRKAQEWEPDLLVLGCHGRTAIGRLLMGSVSQKLLHHSHTNIRIVRSPKRDKHPGLRILLALDGSVGSDATVWAVAARYWPQGTRIRILTALEGTALSRAMEGIRAKADISKGLRAKWMEKKCEAAVKLLAPLGLTVEPAMRVGDPRLSLLREAKEWGADCIFMGSRGLGGVDSFVLGSVSTSVTAHADCTVEVVRRHRPKPAARKRRKA